VVLSRFVGSRLVQKETKNVFPKREHKLAQPRKSCDMKCWGCLVSRPIQKGDEDDSSSREPKVEQRKTPRKSCLQQREKSMN